MNDPLVSAAPSLATGLAAPVRADAEPGRPAAWRLALRQTGRDFRAGELRLLGFAVVLAVAALTAVSYFADRIDAGLARDARQLLGGDAVIASDQPAPASFLAKAREYGLATATTATFPSMGRAPDPRGGAARLVGVKAVSDAYPLRGRVTTAIGASAIPDAAHPPAAAGTVSATPPGTASPALPGTVSPTLPGTVSPATSGTASPVAPGMASPVPPGTASPAPPGTVSPANSGTASPAPPGTASPAPAGTPSPPPSALASPTPSAPAPGTVWVDPGLLGALRLAPGDALLLGDATLRIAATIVNEPDRGAGMLSFSPRVLMNAADLPSTGLVQPASRITYRLAVAATDADERGVRAFSAWAEAEIKNAKLHGVRVESLATGRPEMRQTLDRAGRFLNLVALLAALLAAVAVAIASREFASRHLDDCAMLRVLGLPQRTIAWQYAIEFGAVGLAASIVGVVAGFLVHHGFVLLLAGLVDSSLPPPGPGPALFGIGVGMTLLLGFGLPPVLQLARVPPLRVIRRDVGALKPASLAVLGAGGLGFAGLLLAVASDLKLGLIAVGGFAGAGAVFALLSWGAVLLLRRAVPEARAPRWLILATRQIAARPAFAVLQVSALAIGLLALVLLVLLRTDLIASWQRATPPDAPDRFVINVQPDQAAAFRQRLEARGVARYDWFPMIRGRLVAINGKPVGPASYAEDRAQRLVDREFNLSDTAALPAHNQVVAGHWTPNEANAVSVEEGLANTLGLKLGDALRFDIGGVPAEGRITSLRKVDWSSMRVNFFVIFPSAPPPEVPVSYIAAYRAPAPAVEADGRSASARGRSAPGPAVPTEAGSSAAPSFDDALARDFPNITSFDVSATIGQVQRVLDQVVRAVEFLFGFTLAAGLVVLFAAVTATRESRSREFAVMRALGASSALLAKVQRAELLGIGALAGVLASLAAMAVGWALARWVFEFAWTAAPWVPLAGGAAGALLALAAGWWGLREVLTRPVVQTLRQATE